MHVLCHLFSQLQYTLEANFHHTISSASVLFLLVIACVWAAVIYSVCFRSSAAFQHRDIAGPHQPVENHQVIDRQHQGEQQYFCHILILGTQARSQKHPNWLVKNYLHSAKASQCYVNGWMWVHHLQCHDCSEHYLMDLCL